MTVYLDTSALVAVAVDGAARNLVIDALEHDTDWCSSALSIGEAMALVARLTDEEVLQNELEDAVRLLWDRMAVVPVDQQCLDRAAHFMRHQPVTISNAIHLAADDRLPRPITFVSFDSAQIPVALGMEWDVTSTRDP